MSKSFIIEENLTKVTTRWIKWIWNFFNFLAKPFTHEHVGKLKINYKELLISKEKGEGWKEKMTQFVRSFSEYKFLEDLEIMMKYDNSYLESVLKFKWRGKRPKRFLQVNDERRSKRMLRDLKKNFKDSDKLFITLLKQSEKPFLHELFKSLS